jgi:class 3 adenylate cyclase
MVDGVDEAGSGFQAPADLRTFLIADMRGSTAYAERYGDEAAARLAGRFAELVGAAVAEHGGRVVELRGDEAMAAFTSARAAVRASVAVQERCRGGAGEPLPLGVGTGLDAGEAVALGDGYRARALNVAARLCSAAASGEILATDTVCRLAGPIEEAGYSRVRHVRAKGVAEALAVRVVEPSTPLPSVASPPPGQGRRRRLRGRWIASAAAVAVGTIAVFATLVFGRHGGHAVRLRPDSIAEIDPAILRPVADVRLSGAPGELAAGGSYVWAAEPRSDSVARIDVRTRAAPDVGIGITPGAIAVGLGEVWAYDAGAGRIEEIDPGFAAGPTGIRLPACAPLRCVFGGLAAGDGGLWVGRSYNGAGSATNPGIVWKLGADGRPTTTIRRMPADRLALAPHAVWAYGNNGFDVVEAQTNSRARQTTRLKVAAEYNQPGMTFAFGHAWVVSPTGQYLAEIVPEGNGGGLLPTIPLPPDAYDIAHDRRWLWITTGSGELIKVDPYRRRVVATFPLGYEASGVAVAGGKVWVALGAKATS